MRYVAYLRAADPSDPGSVEDTTVHVDADDEAAARLLALAKAPPPMFLSGCEWIVIAVEAAEPTRS